jgi:hypothetical protein
MMIKITMIVEDMNINIIEGKNIDQQVWEFNTLK